MLYRLVKILMRSALGLFYHRSMLRNLHHIPASGPILLIANHPSSLMDAAFLGALLKRPVHFFARGDVFINPLVTRILRALHMHPLHHHQEGRHTLDLNNESFETAIELLKAGEVVLFFPEGSSHTDYHLRPFRKGAFRIALQAVSEAAGMQPLPVVPIGLNYSHPTRIFSTVWVQSGQPLWVNDYLERYRHHAAAGVRSLTQDAEKAVRALCLHAMQGHSPQLYEVLNIWRNQESTEMMEGAKQIEREMIISNTQPKWMHLVIEDLQQYLLLLEQHDTEDRMIALAARKKFSAAPLVLGFPAAMAGWMLNGIPLLTAKVIADRKVKRVDFYSWILVAAAALLTVCWYLLLAVGAFLLLPAWKALTLLFIAYATGQYSWNYYRYFHQWRLQQKGRKLPEATLAQAREFRNKILAAVEAMIDATSPA